MYKDGELEKRPIDQLRVNWAEGKDMGPDKDAMLERYRDMLLNKTVTMFEYENLPDSIPERDYELFLQTHGKGIIVDSPKNGGVIFLTGNYAPPMDAYYHPKRFLVANPWADINREFTTYNDEEAVLIRNDPMERGILPIIEKYANHLLEIDISIDLAGINMRDISVISAGTDEAAEGAREYNEQKKMGRQGIIVDTDLTVEAERCKIFNNSVGVGYITQLLETRQYWLAQFYNEIGLNANFNMKRESINSSETELNEDGLRPLIDVMLEDRQKGWERANKRFGTNVKVKFGSSWARYNEEGDDKIEKTESETDTE